MRCTKITIGVLLAAGLAGSAVAPAQEPVGTAFTYQGSLSMSGSPANGEFDFKFDLWDDAAEGMMVAPTSFADDVPVVDGLFTAAVDFGPAFRIEARWIEVSVREGASGGPYTPLLPRQKVTPAPIALRALGGVGPPNALTVLSNGRVGIGTEDPGEDLHVVGTIRASNSLFVGEASIAINSATDTITATSGTIGFDDENLWTTGRVGIGLSGFPLADLQIVGSALPDFSGFLSAEDAILEDDVAWLGLYSQNSQTGTGSGITLGEIEVEGNNKWAIYRRPTDNEGDLVITYGGNSNPGANTKMMQIKPDGDVILAPVTGNVGIGRYDPEAPLHAYAENSSFTPPTVARFESRETPGTFVFHRSLDFSGHGIDAYDIENGGGTTLSFNGVGGSDGDVQMVRGGGDVGIGGVPQTKLHVYNGQVGAGGLLSGEDLLVEDDGAAWIGLYSDDDGGIVGGVAMVDVDNGNKWAMYRRTTSNVGDLVFTYGTDVNPGANEKILQLKPDGTTAVKVLEITGADVAERFPMTDTVEPGMVVEIDPDNAGQLRLARGAYNRRVAGVVSGAGDLPVGAILGNLPGHENAPPIALSGRVWVRCDASNGPIQPGDLLTTAERPGHAMKVTDYPRAQGAIIGKAMSALAQGESGLVLVLVNLQ